MENKEGRALGWDDEIENDGEEFTMIPEGDYSFQVAKFERARFNGSDYRTDDPALRLGIGRFPSDDAYRRTRRHRQCGNARTCKRTE